ncbi:MAG: sialate O-acetylesterase [Verrucomicrobiota bacterium]|nr:sialate O-acetylesterase [Verrucomicrobiota bacterium]
MKLPLSIIVSIFALMINGCSPKGSHLFILSGQSNMAGLDPETSFIPRIHEQYGAENSIIVKDALGGQPIRRWYKDWKPAKGDEPEATGDLYDQLMEKVRAATEDKRLHTITFLWMQGERDAREMHGEVYEESLGGLVAQLENDLGREGIHVVIARLSDFDMANETYPHWTRVREAQVAFADSRPKTEWVDTDDLNDGVNKKGDPIKNDLHYSVSGYNEFGDRLAQAAIRLAND